MGETYPIQLKLASVPCVVVGGGAVAARKVQSLLAGGARITVVSPQVEDAIKKHIANSQIAWREKTFSQEDLTGAVLVFACTHGREINEEVYRCLQPGQWINVADRPELSSFYVPAHFRRGPVTVSVATDGASPGLARKIKEKLKEEVDEAYGIYGEFLARCRKRILEEVQVEAKRRALFSELLDEDYLEAFRRGKAEKAWSRFNEMVEEATVKEKGSE